MAAQYLQSGPAIPVVQQSQEGDWVVRGSTPNVQSSRDFNTAVCQTKLLFNEAIPATPSNRATRVGPPAPIVIERLLPPAEQTENVDSTRSSVSFTALSEERLQAAIKLAKRDLRRRRLEAVTKSTCKPSQEASLYETSDVELLRDLAATPSKSKLKASSPKEKSNHPGPKRLVHKCQTHCISLLPRTSQSPPTRDPGPRQPKRIQPAPLSQEILKLQNELQVYIQKVEELANRDNREGMEEPLEPDEQKKLEIRRQKQAARSARVIYVLQQQVKEIQEDIEKLQNLKIVDSRKDTTINRLSAAHRGAIRALQAVIQQLPDLSLSKVPPHYKELGRLIRQLSLCSATLEVGQGSAVPEIALDILQKLETLDSAIRKKEMVEKMQTQACAPHRRSPAPRVSPTSTPNGPTSVQGPRKTLNPRRGVHGRRMAPHKAKPTSHQMINRREALKTNLQSLIQQRELTEQQKQPQTNTGSRTGPQSGQRKTHVILKRNQIQDAGFQQPTVSSKLRVNHLPQKEHSVPWMPTSPHSPPPHRSPQRTKPEPRCLFSTVKSLSPPTQKGSGGVGAESTLSLEKKKQAQTEALRKAWLDKVTMQRLKELNLLTKKETECIQRLRSEVVSPSQWAERAERKARDRIQPLLDEAQQIGESRNRIRPSLRNQLPEQAAEMAAKTMEHSSEALLEDLLEDTALATWAAETDRQLEDVAQCRLQAPTLESILLRMSEIERDQEEVRRRFASITYSDPLYWDQPQAAGPQHNALSSRPASPQPIRLTRPLMKQTSAADIFLEKPVESGILFENSLTEEGSQEGQRPRSSAVFPGPLERCGGSVIALPGSTLRNIRHYRENYEAYLHVVGHETVGTFNPWAVAESLAEKLLSEAVADVAADFQDVVEEYAEAVFTSEFLRPIESPPASTTAQVFQ